MSSKYGKIKNRQLKKQWLTDLRSGNYKQSQGQLCWPGTKNSKASYCCLGVLCRSIKKINALPITFIKDGSIEYKNVSDPAELPTSLRKAVGLTIEDMEKLIDMNDDQGKNFKEIADFIEKNL